MNAKKPSELLNEEIRLMESKQAYEFQLLRQQFHLTAERLKPANLIANTVRDMVTLPATGNNLIDSGLGIATEFLSKKFLSGSSTNPIKRLFGTLLQFGISNIVYKNTHVIKAIGGTIFQSIFSKKKEKAGNPESILIR